MAVLYTWSGGTDGAFSDAEIDTSGSSWTIASNRLEFSANYAYGGFEFNGTADEDQSVEVKMFDETDAWYRKCLRVRSTAAVGSVMGTTGGGYVLEIINPDAEASWYFYRDGTGVFGFASQAFTFVDGDVMKLEAIGDTVSWYRNDVLLESYTDGTPLTGGQPSFFTQPYEISFAADDVVFEDASTAGGSAPPRSRSMSFAHLLRR